MAGPGKVDHWRTLARARAIENTAYVAAVGQPGPRYTGHSLVVGPAGEQVAEVGDGEHLLTATVDAVTVADADRRAADRCVAAIDDERVVAAEAGEDWDAGADVAVLATPAGAHRAGAERLLLQHVGEPQPEARAVAQQALEARLIRLETKRGTGQFDGLSYEQIERALFDRLHRLATVAGGIDELMAEWDAATNPEEQACIAQIRSHERDVRASYLEMEARLCPRP